ncbi:MAG TPA: AMP-binding protein [Ilumatobacter sp.]|nr:AMP-binding protein [Ilumatobacter sp.]
MIGAGQILPESARRFGAKTALRANGRDLSYAELDDLSNRVAVWLAACGIAPGDRVSIYSANRWEWIVAYHGALKAGTVVNPVNVMLTADELRFVLGDCGSSLLFASGERLAGLDRLVADVPTLRGVVGLDDSPNATATFTDVLATPVPEGFAPHQPEPTEASTIGYTSGTTGHPKGAVQSHQAVLLSCRATAEMHGRTASDVVVTALPAPHVYGNVVVNSTFLVGGTVVLMERFDPAAALQLIDVHQATMFEGVPAMYSMMLSHPDLAAASLHTLTRCTVGGQTIASATVAAWQAKAAAPLIELWGMTELAGLGTTHWHDGLPVPGSIGVALDCVELRVADLNDPARDAAVGEPGELMARGPLVMLEYFGNPAATAEAIEADGWMHTGDIASVDASGHYFVVDRRKDMIITGGYNVYPAEIERVLAGHPAVALVAVGPVPDPVKGELAKAYVVLREGVTATEQEIVDYSREHLAPYKRPRKVAFVLALPQTSTGKIMRRELINLVTPG